MLSFGRHPRFVGAVSVLLLGVYLIASVGVLPSPRVVSGWFGHLTGERYPCEDCGCGCASAGECWTHCCCHTEHQRLMWAIEHGVLPPKSVEFTDAQWIAAANAVKPGSAHCALCVGRIKDELRRGIATEPVERCADVCGAQRSASCCTEGAAEKPLDKSCCQKQGSASWPGPSISALTCKGLKALLAFVILPAPPTGFSGIILPEAAPFMAARPEDAAYTSRTLDTPAPPPRA